jgi:CheY-like chemotaxis protein
MRTRAVLGAISHIQQSHSLGISERIAMATVLVVNANPITRNQFVECLHRGGYAVLEAANHTEAIRIIELSEREIHVAVLTNPEFGETARQIITARPATRI